jgi:glucose/arabinose dehydrogenase
MHLLEQYMIEERTTIMRQNIRVSVFARGLEYPYSLAFLPNGDLLFTERPGRLRIVQAGRLVPEPVAGGPGTQSRDRSGLLTSVHGYMSLLVHRRFAENRFIYLAYNKKIDDKTTAIAVARARLENNALVGLTDILVSTELRGTVSLAMTADDRLWVAT